MIISFVTTSRLVKNAASILIQGIYCINDSSHWTMFSNYLHQQILIAIELDFASVIQCDNWRIIIGEALLTLFILISVKCSIGEPTIDCMEKGFKGPSWNGKLLETCYLNYCLNCEICIKPPSQLKLYSLQSTTSCSEKSAYLSSLFRQNSITAIEEKAWKNHKSGSFEHDKSVEKLRRIIVWKSNILYEKIDSTLPANGNPLFLTSKWH